MRESLRNVLDPGVCLSRKKVFPGENSSLPKTISDENWVSGCYDEERRCEVRDNLDLLK